MTKQIILSVLVAALAIAAAITLSSRTPDRPADRRAADTVVMDGRVAKSLRDAQRVSLQVQQRVGSTWQTSRLLCGQAGGSIKPLPDRRAGLLFSSDELRAVACRRAVKLAGALSSPVRCKRAERADVRIAGAVLGRKVRIDLASRSVCTEMMRRYTQVSALWGSGIVDESHLETVITEAPADGPRDLTGVPKADRPLKPGEKLRPTTPGNVPGNAGEIVVNPPKNADKYEGEILECETSRKVLPGAACFKQRDGKLPAQRSGKDAAGGTGR